MGRHRSSQESKVVEKASVESFGCPCLICFVDLIGSSAVSSELNPEEYWQKYIHSFYVAIERAKDAAHETKLTWVDEEGNGPLKPKWDYRGDELVGFVFLDDRPDRPPDPVNVGAAIGDIVRFIHGLRLLWLGSCYNQRRLFDHQVPRGIAAGIHYGRVVRVVPEDRAERVPDEKKFLNVGYAINVAKRVESMSRLGASSGIFATGEVKYLYHRWVKDQKKRKESFDFPKGIRFGELGIGPNDKFKGIDPVPHVCELEPDETKAPEVLGHLKDGKLPHNLEVLGEYLLGKRNNRGSKWMEQDEVVGGGGVVIRLLECYARQSSNLWLQIDACLLLAAIGRASDGADLFRFVEESLHEKLKYKKTVAARSLLCF